jgi:Ca2+-binding EF-hand superfamily protein
MSRKAVEISINTLIQKILNKVETLSGFGSANVQLRFLLQRLKFYEDPNKKEMISFENFQQFLLRLNCISINLREVEELFSLFDTEMIGSINYLEFAYTLYNSGPYPVLANDALEVMNMIRSYLMKLDYHESIRFYWWVRALSDGKLAGDYFVKEVYNILDHKIPVKSLQLLVDRFDFERNGYIHVPSFLRSFTVSFHFHFLHHFSN